MQQHYSLLISAKRVFMLKTIEDPSEFDHAKTAFSDKYVALLHVGPVSKTSRRKTRPARARSLPHTSLSCYCCRAIPCAQKNGKKYEVHHEVGCRDVSGLEGHFCDTPD